MKLLRTLAAVAVALALAGGDEAWAGKGRGGSASSGSSAKSSSGTRSHHHRHGSRFGTVIVGTSLFGASLYPWYAYPAYYPGPYYYGPDFRARSTPPQVYIERFDGDPAASAEDFIFCPQSDTMYPEAKECPGGWARIVTGTQTNP